MMAAVDLFDQGNWFSAGLQGLHMPVDVRACAGSRSLLVVDTDPFQVVLADVSMGTGTGSKGVPVIDGIDCQDCEPACLSLSIQTDAMSAVGLSAVGYGRGQADLSLSGFTALSVDASLVLHPFCCDWESVPLAKPAGHVNAGLWAEAMTSGQVRFQVGEFELDACGCTGIRPVWRSNVAWVGCSGSALYISDPDRVEYGHVQAVSMSDTSASGYSVKWSGVVLTSGVSFNADAIALNWVPVLMRGAAQTVMGIDGVQVGCLEGAGRTLSSLGVSAWVVQWPEVMSRSTVHSNAYPVAEDERVRRISIPRFAARAYSPVNTVDVSPCEQAVFALHDGCLVEDIVKAWVDESGMAEIGHTHDRVTVRSADSGELLFIKVLRASGQVAEFRVKVS